MAETIFSLTQQQYEGLIALAREGTKTDDGQVLSEKARQLDAFLKNIEKANGITRSGLWVQWQELDEPLPPSTNFPDVWPPQYRFYIELVTRLVARADVEAVIAARAKSPHNVLVTQDPGALVGWTTLDDFFITG